MGLEYTPATPTLVPSLTRTQVADTGTQTLFSWLPGADSLVLVGVQVTAPQTGSVVATAAYTDPNLATTASATVLDSAVTPASPVSGLAQLLVRGAQPVSVAVTPTGTGSVWVSAQITVLREGA